VHFGSDEKGKIKDSVWAVAYGLAILGFNAENEQTSIGVKNVDKLARSSKQGWRLVKEWVSHFLP
jgi:hypothetical protein